MYWIPLKSFGASRLLNHYTAQSGNTWKFHNGKKKMVVVYAIYNRVYKIQTFSCRVELLNQRVAVISDLLDMLKDNLNSTHGEKVCFDVSLSIINCLSC